MTRTGRKCLIAVLLGLAVSVAILLGEDAFNADSQQAWLRALCDAFFVPGVILCGFGLLLFVANDGFFDMINYGVLKVLKLVQREEKRAAFPKTFYEYKVMKDGSRKGGFAWLVWVGLGFIALAAVFLVPYFG